MKIALGQLNPLVGDISGNVEKIADAIARSAKSGADLVVFAELSVTGYPPRDLLRKEQFVRDNVEAINTLAAKCTNITALVGFVRPVAEAGEARLQNAAAVLAEGRIQHVHIKTFSPSYDVFDESRYFRSGPKPQCIEIAHRKVGVTICEDLRDTTALSEQSPEIIINMSASPFEMHKGPEREELLKHRARRSGATIVYINQVGGNDELVFDSQRAEVLLCRIHYANPAVPHVRTRLSNPSSALSWHSPLSA